MKKMHFLSTGLLLLIFCITTGAQTLTVSTTQTNIACNSVCNGSATATPSGGVTPYTYSWSPGSFSTATITSLCAGTYTAYVTDGAATQRTSVVTITQPPLLTITTSYVGATCGNPNGSATANVSGGTPPYTYSWNPSGITTLIANLLSAGTYTVTVTDANGCIATHSVVVTNSPGPTASISGTTNVSCFGGNNGSITSTAFGGSPPYSYSWNTVPSQHTVTATSLSAGSYTLTITDGNGCTANAVATITQPPPLTNYLTSISPSCQTCCDGAINASTSGGTAQYTYSWSPPPLVTAVPGLNGLCSGGTYTCVISDANGCTVTNTTSPAYLTINITSTNVSCNGGANGSATANVTGGTAPYSYTWTPISGSSPSVSSLLAGTFVVTIHDANGNSNSASVVITQPAMLTVSPGTTIPASCHLSDGSVSPNVSGGTPPWTCLWNTTPVQTTFTATNLTSGTYSMTVTDANGCTATQGLTLGDSCKYVWPGDANDDGVADNNDILAIGVGNGTVGTIRTGASLTWIGQPSTNWIDTLISGSNYKFIDCNGDGTINNSDTTAVVQNFNMIHNVRLPAPPPYDFSLPDLYIHHTTDTVAANSHGSFQIGLGRSTMPANNIYGVAFTIHFNSTLVVPSSVSMNLNSSWMGTNGVNLIGVGHTPSNSGITAVGIVRTNQTDISGNGYIATVNYMTSNSLTGTGQSQQLGFTITGVNVISANQHAVSVNAVNDSIIVIDPALITGIKAVGSNAFHLSAGPNPFDTYTTIYVEGKGTLNYILYDIAGRELRKFQSAESTVTLNRDGLENGLYILKVFSGKGIVGEEKLVVR
jgi:hypothetical protein